MTRVRFAAVLLVACSALLASCGGSGYQYLTSDDHNLYLKVPEGWRVFDERELYPRPDLLPLELQRKAGKTPWFRGFDSSENASLENLLDPHALTPRGYAVVLELRSDAREEFNLSALRGLYLEVDPVKAQRDDPHGKYEVLLEEDVTLPGGEHGVRVVVAYEPDQTGLVDVIDHTAVLDARSELLYQFVIGCSEPCYLANRDTIREVVDSWTIEEG